MMTYLDSLPRIENLLLLARIGGPFPARARDIAVKARIWGFNRATLDFLKQIPPGEEFTTRDEFVARCEELEHSNTSSA